MKTIKTKLVFFLIFALFFMFFSNDFGLVDIEKTAIITALSIDLEEDKYLVTAQIAVPEATDTNAENKKAQISGRGYTIGGAIKDIGNVSGWYPQLSFCNLIVIGKDLAQTNVIRVLDYFAKTLRVQDSALIVMSETYGYDLLNASSPMDTISSFAIQKIILKNPGFDKDTLRMDIKGFSSGYYSDSQSSFMPIIKLKEESNEDESSSNGSSNGSGGSQGGSGEESKNKTVFDASTTALFYKGSMVGSLDKEQTSTLNALFGNFSGSTFTIKDVISEEDYHNYLLTVFSEKPMIEIIPSVTDIKLKVTLDMYCKISDQNATKSDSTYSKNNPLPLAVKEKAEEYFTGNIDSLIETLIQTKCDFLKLKEKLYRYYNSVYSNFKDNYLDLLTYEVKVNVTGQK